MKKLVSFLMVAIMLLGIATVANAAADNFVKANVGDYFEIPLLDLVGEADYQCYGVPDGLYIDEDHGAGHTWLTLKGNASAPGTYYFSVDASDGQSVSYEIMVRDPNPEPTYNPDPYPPEPPVTQPPYFVSQSRAENLTVGDSCYVYVDVANPGGYELYYNWFVNDVQVYGADASSYYVDTSHPCNDGYYCRVDYYVNGVQNSIYSDNIPVTVKAAKVYVTSIEMAANPYKLEYRVGEYLDTSGMGVRVYYSDGKVDTVYSGFVCNPSYITITGPQNINVQYGGCYTMFKIKAKEPVVLTSISVSRAPDKINYNIGEPIDTCGMVLHANYSDGNWSIINSGYTINPNKFLNEGNQRVQVFYEDKSTSFNVMVQDPNKTTGITVQSLPEKLEYKVGDTLDIKGLKLKINNAAGGQIIDAANNSKVKVEPSKLTKAGQQVVTVTYTDGSKYESTFNVHVSEVEASPSPSVSPSASPAASESPAPDNQNNTTSILMIVTIASLVACVVLIVLLVVILNNNKKPTKH